MIAEFAFSDNPISVVYTDYVVVGGSFLEEPLCVFTLRYSFDFIGCGAGVFSDYVEYRAVVSHHRRWIGEGVLLASHIEWVMMSVGFANGSKSHLRGNILCQTQRSY